MGAATHAGQRSAFAGGLVRAVWMRQRRLRSPYRFFVIFAGTVALATVLASCSRGAKSDNRRTGCHRPFANVDGDSCPCDPYTRANRPAANGHTGPGTPSLSDA